MKTLIDIDGALMEKAMDISQATTKKETIHRALEAFIKLRLRERLKQMAGSGATAWSLGDLKTSRQKRERTHIRLVKDGK